MTITMLDQAEDRPMDRADRLVAFVTMTDRAEADWLADLAAFDADGEYEADGHASTVVWLMWRCRMARPTACDKLRVARQLALRPGLRRALATGRASYSAVRAITRAADPLPDPEVDEALLVLAETGSVADVEVAVRTYNAHADQHRPPSTDVDDRDARIRSTGDRGTLSANLFASEAAELDAILDQIVDHLWRAEHPSGHAEEGERPRPTGARRADALLTMARLAADALHRGRGDDPAAASERFLVTHVHVEGAGDVTTLEGETVDPADAACANCDGIHVEHRVTSEGEPLWVGRATRSWTRAQRRAAALRDGRRCRHPGCPNRIVDLHHQRWWSSGGPTDIDNAISLCRHHHRLQHRGFEVTGNPNKELTFRRPDGSVIGATRPRRPSSVKIRPFLRRRLAS